MLVLTLLSLQILSIGANEDQKRASIFFDQLKEHMVLKPKLERCVLKEPNGAIGGAEEEERKFLHFLANGAKWCKSMVVGDSHNGFEWANGEQNFFDRLIEILSSAPNCADAVKSALFYVGKPVQFEWPTGFLDAQNKIVRQGSINAHIRVKPADDSNEYPPQVHYEIQNGGTGERFELKLWYFPPKASGPLDSQEEERARPRMHALKLIKLE